MAKTVVRGIKAKSTRPTAVPRPPKLNDGEAINPTPAQHRQAQKRSKAMQAQSNRVRPPR